MTTMRGLWLLVLGLLPLGTIVRAEPPARTDPDGEPLPHGVVGVYPAPHGSKLALACKDTTM